MAEPQDILMTASAALLIAGIATLLARQSLAAWFSRTATRQTAITPRVFAVVVGVSLILAGLLLLQVLLTVPW